MIETPSAAPSPPDGGARTPRMTRSQANLIRGFCLWTVWVWGTRIWNILGEDSRSTGFKVVHTVIAAISVGLAVGAWLVVRRLRTPTAMPDPAPAVGDRNGPTH